MIKLTLYDDAGARDVWLNPSYVIAVTPANPKGALISTVRGLHHVNQTVDMVIAKLPRSEGN